MKLSAQQQLDCTKDNRENKKRFGSTYNQDGCYGGFETGTWKFYKQHGAMLEDDYPYTSGMTEKVGRCKHDERRIAMKVDKYGEVDGTI